jgi:hypothetical protein
MNSSLKLVIVGSDAAVLLFLIAAIVDPGVVELKEFIILATSIEEYHLEDLLFAEVNHLSWGSLRFKADKEIKARSIFLKEIAEKFLIGEGQTVINCAISHNERSFLAIRVYLKMLQLLGLVVKVAVLPPKDWDHCLITEDHDQNHSEDSTNTSTDR